MIKRCTIEDVEAVNRILRHPEIYPYSIDDGCSEDANTFDAGPALESENLYFLGWRVGDAWAGLCMLQAWSVATYEIHVSILPPFRKGSAVIHAATKAIDWMYDNTACCKVVAAVPVINKAAIFFAMSMGMVEEGLMKKSFMKDGVLVDQMILGIVKGG